MRIDSHQHFWQYNDIEYDWINEKMGVLKNDFLPSDLINTLRENNMQGCVAVQARQSLEETEWLLSLANENAFIKGVVGWVDLLSDRLEEQLIVFNKEEKLKGFRHVLQAEESGYMLQPDFIRGIKLLAKYGYSYDILINSSQLSEVCQLVEQLPVMNLVIDHIAKPNIAEQQWDGWHEYISKLAGYDHIYCKISGMVTEANWKTWNNDDLLPYIKHCIEKFGSNRCMFGSDWPVCKLASRYEALIDCIDFVTDNDNEQIKANIFSVAATTFYRLKHDAKQG